MSVFKIGGFFNHSLLLFSHVHPSSVSGREISVKIIILFNFAYYSVDSATSLASGQLVYSLVEKINESEFV